MGMKIVIEVPVEVSVHRVDVQGYEIRDADGQVIRSSHIRELIRLYLYEMFWHGGDIGSFKHSEVNAASRYLIEKADETYYALEDGGA